MAFLGVGVAAAMAACGVSVQGEEDGGAGDAGDGDAGEGMLVSAIPAVVVGAAGRVTIRRSFDVLLEDRACAGHAHGLRVLAGSYDRDTPVEYLGGSHLVRLRPSELVRLEAGEVLPFATVGPGPGHGHCGRAVRAEMRPRLPADREAYTCALRDTTAECTVR